MKVTYEIEDGKKVKVKTYVDGRVYKYDEKGNKIYLKDSDGYEMWWEYDANGNMIHHRACPIFLHQILRPEHHLLFFCHLTILNFATKVQIYLHTTQIMGGYLSSILEIQQLLFHFFIVPLRQC